MTEVWGLLAVIALIAANGWFVAAEFAFVSVRLGQLEELAAAGDRRAARGVSVRRRLSFVLSGAQLGITATSLLVGFIAEPVLGDLIEPLVALAGFGEQAASGIALTIGFILATGAQMIFGELAPKNLAIARPLPVAVSLARSTQLFTRLAGPVIRVFDGSANALLRVFGVEVTEEEETRPLSPEELGIIITESTEQGALAPSQAKLLVRVLQFRTLRAADAMVPRNQVVSLPGEATCAELRRLAADTGLSRFPVVGEGLDDVRGIVEVRDVLRVDPAVRDRTAVRNLLRPVLAVPESAPLGQLLADLRAAHRQMAVVVDEYGGTEGIVTLEDIVEELVGSIEDEYDLGEPLAQRLGDGAFLVPGSWRLDEVRRETGVELPAGDYDTLGGLVMQRLGRVPEVGDEVVVAGAVLVVEAMDDHAVQRVHLAPTVPGGPEDGS